MLKEDYYINLCKRAINLVNEARGADERNGKSKNARLRFPKYYIEEISQGFAFVAVRLLRAN